MKTMKDKEKRSILGKVVSVKMNKTIVVQTERKVKHGLYGKFVNRYSKMYAHDDKQVCQEGDFVRITMCRPLSKNKTWVLDAVLRGSVETTAPASE